MDRSAGTLCSFHLRYRWLDRVASHYLAFRGTRGEALKGHLDLLLLASLLEGPRHGYAIIEHLRARSGGRFDLPEGTVYPALHRLEHGGLVESTWAEGTPRPRRVYALTPAGDSALRRRQDEWDAFVAGVAGVLGD